MAFDQRARAGLLRIEFEAEELAGLVVIYRPATLGAAEALLELTSFEPVVSLSGENVTRLKRLAREFAPLIVAWDLEEDGIPTPVSAEAFLSLDALFVLQVTMTWARVTAGLPQIAATPVEQDDDEPEFDESSLPMERLAAV